MSAWWAAAVLGFMTGICNCSLATNILAVSFIGRQLKHPRQVLLSGVLYALGRTLAYVVVAVLLVKLALAREEARLFLDRYLDTFLGPVLIVIGMFLLGMIPLSFGGLATSEKLQARIAKLGLAGPLLLGVLFALALCPVAASWFLSLLALCAERRSAYLLPVIYGAGTALPALVLAFLLAYAAKRAGETFNKLALFEKWARRFTGAAFIVVGIYYTLVYIYWV